MRRLLLALALLACPGAPAEQSGGAGAASPKAVPLFLEINKITPATYAGAVSAAMEGLRLVHGPMTAEEEKRFEKKWQPAFEYCTPELIEYLNKLNPLLGRFLGLRAALAEAAQAFDAAQLELAGASALQDELSVRECLASLALQRVALNALNKELAEVVAAIEALGDPPDPGAARKRARKQYENLLRALAGTGPAVHITWEAPPPGWCEWARMGFDIGNLPISPEADRSMFLVDKGAGLDFTSQEYPGECSVKIRPNRDSAMPPRDFIEDAVEMKPNLEAKRKQDTWQYSLEFFRHAKDPKYIVSRKVTDDRLFGFPALRVETEEDPGREFPEVLGFSRKRTVCWLVDLGAEPTPACLQVTCRMEWCDICWKIDSTSIYSDESREGQALKASLRALGERRYSERYQAMLNIWQSEVDRILGAISVQRRDAVPDGEKRRFTAHGGYEPTPQVQAARGAPQIENGAWVLHASVGDVGGGTAERNADLEVHGARSDFTVRALARASVGWSEPPSRVGRSETVTVRCPWPQLTLLDPTTKEALPKYDILPDKTVLDCCVGLETGWQGGRKGHVFPLLKRGAAGAQAGVLTFDMKVFDSERLLGATFKVELSGELNTTGHGFSKGPSRKFLYIWDWMPSRQARGAPADGPDQPPPPAKATRQELEQAKVEAEVKARQIEFCRNEVKNWEEELGRLQGELRNAPPQAIEGLEARIRWAKDWAQKARDEIATLETGQFVRTRTEADAYNLSVMAAESDALATKWNLIHAALDRGPRLVALAEPGEQLRLQRFLNDNLTQDVIAAGDVGRIRRTLDALGNQVMGQLEHKAAQADEEALAATEKLERAENLRSVADLEMTAFSIGCPNPISAFYFGATGFVDTAYEKGLAEGIGSGVRGALSTYNEVVMLANAGFAGYEHGVLEAHEKYAAHPGGGGVNENAAGVTGAAWELGKTALLGAAMKWAIGSLSARAVKPSPPSWAEVMAQHRFREDQAGGAALVREFRERMGRVAAAGRAGAARDEILALRRATEETYKSIKTDFFAKMCLKQLSTQGGDKTIHYYNSIDREYTKRLFARFGGRMEADGVGGQKYKLFSNSASKGKVGMDVDLGVVEPPRFTFRNGKGEPNPEHAAWLNALSRRQADGSVVRLAPHELREIGKRNLEEAFAEVYGRRPDQAFLAFTTSSHPEAYRDLAWLGRKGMKIADIANIDPRWAQQAADVSAFKVNDLPHEHPCLGYYATMQEQCRGLVKDFETKLFPLLGRSDNQEAAKHMRKIHTVMEWFASDKIGPITADQRIKLLTGGEGLAGVADRFRVMIEGLARKK